MRRLAAVLCLYAMLASVAQAKSLLVLAKFSVTGQGTETTKQTPLNQQRRNARLIQSCIAATGGSVTTVRSEATKTEWARAGYMVWNMGNTTPAAPSPGAYKEQFDAVIVADPGETTTGAMRADSLFRSVVQGGATRTDAAKPLLFLRTNENALTAVSDFIAGTDTTYGASDTDNGPGKAIHAAGDHIAFLTHAYTEGGLSVGEESATRRILFGNIPQADYRVSNGTNSGATLGCRNCDSLITYAATDTCILWDRQYSTLFGQASTAVVASPWGAGAADDSIANTVGDPYKPPTEGDLTILMCALAHLDSLSGHKVFGNKVIRIAPVVYGALARGPRHSWNWNKTQGINPADTSSFYAILDSLTAHPEIKITFAANVDSAAEYARDIIKLKSVPQARFTPQVWDGVDDTTLTGPTRFPVDVFGRWRKRIAYGDSATHAVIAGNDTSIYWLAKRARAMCDSIFPGRTSRIAVAPADDWSPLTLTGASRNTSPGIDSVLWALQQAGYLGIIADAQDPDANASKTNAGPSKTNPRGYYNTQMRYVNHLPGTAAAAGGVTSFTAGGGIDMKILCHSGFNLMGGRSQAESYQDVAVASAIDSSSAPATSVFTIYKELARLWESALLEYDESYDLWPYDNTAVGAPQLGNDILRRKLDYTMAQSGVRRPVRHGNIVRLSCADLSGASGSSIVPAATMWHVLKAAANAMYYINKLAGRTVVVFDYPDNIVP